LKTVRTPAELILRELLIEIREAVRPKLKGRLGRPLSQRGLAKRLGRPKSYVVRIESGDQIPSWLETRAWAKACGLTLWAFTSRFETRMRRQA
jgi:transcriptional regulator with XRE-family HTH domain